MNKNDKYGWFYGKKPTKKTLEEMAYQKDKAEELKKMLAESFAVQKSLKYYKAAVAKKKQKELQKDFEKYHWFPPETPWTYVSKPVPYVLPGWPTFPEIPKEQKPKKQKPKRAIEYLF